MSFRDFAELSFFFVPLGITFCALSLFLEICSTYVSPTLHTCQEKSDHSVAREFDDWWVLTIDWSLIIDDWWLLIDDWWLMIDDWWLMTDIIWNIRYSLPQGGKQYGVHFILYQSSTPLTIQEYHAVDYTRIPHRLLYKTSFGSVWPKT